MRYPARDTEAFRRNLLVDRLRALAASEANHDRANALHHAALVFTPYAFEPDPTMAEVLDALKALSPDEFRALIIEERDPEPRPVPPLVLVRRSPA